MITDYTTFEDVRAALGVSEEEIDDNTLSLSLYSSGLDLSFYELSPMLLEIYASLPSEATQTAEQLRFSRLFCYYATFAVAWDVFRTAEMFGYQKVADGRASTERSAKAYENLMANLILQLARVKAALLAALIVLDPTAAPTPRVFPTFVSGVGLAVDPVVG